MTITGKQLSSKIALVELHNNTSTLPVPYLVVWNSICQCQLCVFKKKPKNPPKPQNFFASKGTKFNYLSKCSLKEKTNKKKVLTTALSLGHYEW